MRYISLFSGIEAASVAWEPLGWEPVAFAEIEPFCRELLKQRFPHVPNLGDVTKIDWQEVKDKYGTVELVVGGSPCQSFSIAGKREGLQGESGLMFEYIRAVQELRPDWFLWENVPGALSSEGGAAFEQLLREMDALGYGLAWRVLDAQFFGVAQRRERVFLVGHIGDMRSAEVLFEPESLRGDIKSSKAKRAELAADSGRGADGVHDYTLKLRHTGSPNIGGGSGPLVQTDVSATLATFTDQTLFQSCLTPWDGQAVRVFNPYTSDVGPSLQRAAGESGTPSKTIIQRTFGKTHRASSPEDHTTYEQTELANTLNTFDVGESRANEIVCMTDTQTNTTIVAGGVCHSLPETVGALQARDWKGVGNQYVREGKVIVQWE